MKRTMCVGVLAILATFASDATAGDCYRSSVQAFVAPQQYGQVLLFTQPQQAYYSAPSQQLAIVDSRLRIVNRSQRYVLRNVQGVASPRITIQRRGLFGFRSRVIVD